MNGTLPAHLLARPVARDVTRDVARRMGACLLAAVGLHAALGLGLFLRAQAMAQAQAAAGSPTAGAHHALRVGTASPAAMQVRWAQADAARAGQAMSPPALASAQDASPPLAPTVPQDEAPPAAARAEAEPSESAEVAPDAARDAARGAPHSDADSAFTGYARRQMLDRVPQPLGIVQIAYPAGVEPGRVHSGRLTLFIDETGAVRKVLVLTPAKPEDALPAPFVEAARVAFLQARFSPGERQGVPVKSRIDIEVRFDDREASTLDTAQQPLVPAASDRAV